MTMIGPVPAGTVTETDGAGGVEEACVGFALVCVGVGCALVVGVFDGVAELDVGVGVGVGLGASAIAELDTAVDELSALEVAWLPLVDDVHAAISIAEQERAEINAARRASMALTLAAKDELSPTGCLRRAGTTAPS
jgi:hypothetical protein